MSLAAVPLAVVLTVFTLTLTTPATTQETTTPETPDSDQPDNNCTFNVDNSTYYLAEGDVKSMIDGVGTSFTWYLCQDGTTTIDTVSCLDFNQCADVTVGPDVVSGNNTCVDCNSLYESCVNQTETDDNNNNSSNETETESETESGEIFGGDVPSTDDDSACSSPERGIEPCSRDPAYMVQNCCDFCYNQQFAPVSENSNDTVGSTKNDRGGP